jgi:hypothetical protein
VDYDFPETVGNGISSSQLTFTPFFGGVETNHQPDMIGDFVEISVVQQWDT